MSFNLTSLIPGVGEHYEHVATLGFTTVGLIGTGLAARAALGKGDAAVIPAEKFSLKGVFELVTEFIAGLVDTVIGHHGHKYIPMFATIFLFIFVNNLVGMLPGMTPATENINSTLAMGTFMFLTYNIMGLKENGVAYLKHFLGPVIWLAPIMLPIEIISHLARPASLGLRLANVLMGDHAVNGIFFGIFPIGLPIPFMLMGIFVSFVQAFVFTLLSMVYISLATAHDH